MSARAFRIVRGLPPLMSSLLSFNVPLIYSLLFSHVQFALLSCPFCSPLMYSCSSFVSSCPSLIIRSSCTIFMSIFLSFHVQFALLRYPVTNLLCPAISSFASMQFVLSPYPT
jgi:hypothetical protein